VNAYRWEELSLGMKAQFEASFTEEQARLFAALSGDHNPLHVDHDYAVSAGFRGPVLFGMLTSSLYSQLAGVHLPGRFALLEGIDLNFNSPAFAGEVFTVAGEIVFLSESFRRMEIKATIRREDRSLVSRALLRVGLHA
jgi:3-hydroxybutyryl-CoA dehydratase